jgi:hypothetical protein
MRKNLQSQKLPSAQRYIMTQRKPFSVPTTIHRHETNLPKRVAGAKAEAEAKRARRRATTRFMVDIRLIDI